MASPEARNILNQELISKYRCVPKIGFGFKFGFEKGFRYNTCFFFSFPFLFAGFLDFRLEFLAVIFVCSPVFLRNPSTKVVWENYEKLRITRNVLFFLVCCLFPSCFFCCSLVCLVVPWCLFSFPKRL